MPTYEYLCQACSHRFEQWQKMTDEPLQICPQCGGHIRRVLYPAGVVFKGPGFYKTDHMASPNGKNGANGHTKKQEDTVASTESSTPAESKSSSSEPGSNSTKATTSDTKVPAEAK